MENVTYPNSGALNRAHFALVTKQEQALSVQGADHAARETFEAIKSRMKGIKGNRVGSGIGTANAMESSIGNLLMAGARSWGLHIPAIAPGWDSRKAREDLLLLLYCQASINQSSQSLSAEDLQFAFTTALTLMEAGKTIEERRAGYLFCSQNLIRGHDMQLLMINTIRKDLDSSFTARMELALDSVIANPSSEIIPAVAPRLEDLLSHHFPHIRRRAIHAFRLLSSYDPDILNRCVETLPLRLQDENSSVKCAALGLLEVCAQNGNVKTQDAVQALLGILQQLRQKKNGLRVNQISSIGIRALEVLVRLMPGVKTDMDAMVLSILQVSSRAATKGQRALLLSSFQSLSIIPSANILAVLHSKLTTDAGNTGSTGTTSTGHSSEHPLSFLKNLLQAQDPNITFLLLKCLNLLPALAWAGGAADAQADYESVIAQGEGSSGNGNALGLGSSEPSPASQIDAADLFGESVGANEAHPPSLPASADIKIFPSLFGESDVGAIIGYLKSKDASVRKLTIQTLSRADPSPGGLVNQYRREILTKLASMPSSISPNLDHELRNELVCRALEISDAISLDGGVYCKSVAEVLSQTEKGNITATPTLSPSLSSTSGVSNNTKKSGKGRGRGGVIESAVEMILMRVRGDPDFLLAFTNNLISTMEELKANEHDSISLLVVAAAIICESKKPDQSLSQRAFDLFTAYLLTASVSIQETLLLSMLLLSGRIELDIQDSISKVQLLAQQSSRHIHTRCLQFLDLMADRTKLRNSVESIKDPNITSILALLESTSLSSLPASVSPTVQEKNVNSPPSSSKVSLSSVAPIRKELRYTAYDTPGQKSTSITRPSSQSQNLHTSLLKGKHARRTSNLESPDLVLLSSNLFDDSRKSSTEPQEMEHDHNVVVHNREPKNDLLEVDSPFEVNPASSFSDIGPPPFLPRNIASPVGSPTRSPKTILRSPPISPRNLTPLKGSPRSQLTQLRPGEEQQEREVLFDVNWDRLGAQTGTTSRGWFEGDVESALLRLRNISGVSGVTLVVRNGTEIKVEIKDTRSGFIKLRQEEDGSTLWVFRSGDSGLRRSIRSGLD